MTYQQIKNLTQKEFKRLWVIKPKVFETMVEVLSSGITKTETERGTTQVKYSRPIVNNTLNIGVNTERTFTLVNHGEFMNRWSVE